MELVKANSLRDCSRRPRQSRQEKCFNSVRDGLKFVSDAILGAPQVAMLPAKKVYEVIESVQVGRQVKQASAREFEKLEAERKKNEQRRVAFQLGQVEMREKRSTLNDEYSNLHSRFQSNAKEEVHVPDSFSEKTSNPGIKQLEIQKIISDGLAQGNEIGTVPGSYTSPPPLPTHGHSFSIVNALLKVEYIDKNGKILVEKDELEKAKLGAVLDNEYYQLFKFYEDIIDFLKGRLDESKKDQFMRLATTPGTRPKFVGCVKEESKTELALSLNQSNIAETLVKLSYLPSGELREVLCATGKDTAQNYPHLGVTHGETPESNLEAILEILEKSLSKNKLKFCQVLLNMERDDFKNVFHAAIPTIKNEIFGENCPHALSSQEDSLFERFKKMASSAGVLN